MDRFLVARFKRAKAIGPFNKTKRKDRGILLLKSTSLLTGSYNYAAKSLCFAFVNSRHTLYSSDHRPVRKKCVLRNAR